MIPKQYFFLSLLIIVSLTGKAQTTHFTLKTAQPFVVLYINAQNGNLPLDELPNPFNYEIGIKKGDILSFKSEIDTIRKIIDNPTSSLTLHIIRLDKHDTIVCNFVLFPKPEKASFSKQYKRKYNDKVIVELPEVYELMNVLFAITPTGKSHKYYIYKNTEYYENVLKYFEKYNTEAIVGKIDTLLKNGAYYDLKMESYAFIFNKDNQVEQSKIYSTTSWRDKNYLLPYLDLLNDFASKTKFIDFYNTNKPFYDRQILAYKDSINIKQMRTWLESNFPSTTFNSIKVVFSPLVYGEQSSNTIENNNFKEVHAHVNFPYKEDVDPTFSSKSSILMRGGIVFTEINHGYLSPLSEKYMDKIYASLKDVSKLNKKGRPAGTYNTPTSCFDEYMNWGLVSLYYHDFAEKDELPKLLAANEKYMKGRGFIKFAEFNNFLVDLYHHKDKKQTLEDLYPQLLEWFSKI